MRKLTAASVAIALISASAAQAQTTFHWPAPESAPTGEGQRYYLQAGTPLLLRTRVQISTKDNKPGDRVYLEVAESVTFRGQTVIPMGSPVFAEVAQVQRSGHVGRKGKIEVRLLYAQTPNGQVRLTGSSYDEGKSGTALSVGTMLLVSPLLGFFIHGTSGQIPAGTVVQAHLSEPLRFTWYPQTEPVQTALRPALPDAGEPVGPGFSTLGRE